MDPTRRAGAFTLAEALVALILFGAIPVVVKLISANPWTIGVFRLTIAAAGIFLIAWMRGSLQRLPLRDVVRVAVIGAFFFGHWITYFLSIKASSASIAAIGLSTYGIHLLILGSLFGRARLHAIDVVAVLLAAAGAVAIVPSFDLRNEVTFGMLLATVSATMYASLPILHRRWAHIPNTLRTLGQFGFALLLFLLFLPKTEWTLRPLDWGGLLFLAFGSTLVGHTLWVRVTTRLSPPVTSIIYYGNLPFAIGLSVLVLHEPLTPRIILGAVLIVGGSLLGLGHRWRSNEL